MLLFLAVEVQAECAFDGEDILEGQPLVSVAPVYPSRALRKEIEGCVVLGYALEVRANALEGGLYPHNVVVLSASEEQSRAFEKAARKALSNWLFLARTHEASDDVKYFSVFPFELVEDQSKE